MKSSDAGRAERLYSEIYDLSVPDWPGELQFYLKLADRARSARNSVLEIGCGTGRVAIALAKEGMSVTGLDSSELMLEIARQKSVDLTNVEWIRGDMRAFNLKRTFDLAIIPGHSFQYMLTPGDQIDCLNSIRGHLGRGGRLVVHLDNQDAEWLALVAGPEKGVFKIKQEIKHPETGQTIRTHRAWGYDPSTRTATSLTVWEIVGEDGQTLGRLERDPVLLRCVFRYEMEYLLGLTNYHVEAVYGDFFRSPLGADSEDMIWVASRAEK